METVTKSSVLPAIAAFMFLASPVLARHGDWTTPNHRGSVPYPVQFPPGYRIVGLEVRDQPGYGLCNLRFILEDESGRRVMTPWACENWRGTRRKILLPTGALLAGVEGKEDKDYGILDLRLAYWQEGHTGLRFTQWSCGYQTGRIFRSPIDPGCRPVGFEVREHKTHGLVNFRQLLSPRWHR